MIKTVTLTILTALHLSPARHLIGKPMNYLNALL